MLLFPVVTYFVARVYTAVKDHICPNVKVYSFVQKKETPVQSVNDFTLGVVAQIPSTAIVVFRSNIRKLKVSCDSTELFVDCDECKSIILHKQGKNSESILKVNVVQNTDHMCEDAAQQIQWLTQSVKYNNNYSLLGMGNDYILASNEDDIPNIEAITHDEYRSSSKETEDTNEDIIEPNDQSTEDTNMVSDTDVSSINGNEMQHSENSDTTTEEIDARGLEESHVEISNDDHEEHDSIVVTSPKDSDSKIIHKHFES
jgi:hypothetical protein